MRYLHADDTDNDEDFSLFHQKEMGYASKWCTSMRLEFSQNIQAVTQFPNIAKQYFLVRKTRRRDLIQVCDILFERHEAKG